MKKLLCFIVLLALCMSACSSNASGEDVIFFTLYSLDEYHAYIAEKGADLPENFVYWEDISFIANDCFNCLTIHPNGTYMYNFDDYHKTDRYTGTAIWVNLTPVSSYWALSPVVDSVSGSGDRIAKVSEQNSYFVLKRGACSYHYYESGKLAEIVFHFDGVQFRILGDFEKYPEDYNDTIIARLLSADESVANAAFAEITEKLSK